MKIKPIYLLAAVGAFLLYKRSKKSVVATPPATAGALGAVMTGNPMLEELGSLGSGYPATKRIVGMSDYSSYPAVRRW